MEDYLACVASVDDNVGRLVGWLRDRGDLDDTVLLYGSDQGFFLGDHGWFDKRFMYEESIRMPFLVSYPRAVAAGTTHTGIVSNVDVAQTLLEAAGLPADPRMQGRSFWPDVAGTRAPDPPHDGLYYRYWMHDDRSHHVGAHYGFRTDRYCLVYFYNDGLGVPGCSDERYPAEWELYDLLEDPAELNNVAHDPAYASVRSDLERRLWRAQAAVGDEPHPEQPRPVDV
jgi:arylsulfatase A-like enzyme